MYRIDSVAIFRASLPGGAGMFDIINVEVGDLTFCRDMITAQDVRQAKKLAEKNRVPMVVAPRVLQQVNVALCDGEFAKVSGAIDVTSMDSYRLCAAGGGIGVAVATVGGMVVHCVIQDKKELKGLEKLPATFAVKYTAFAKSLAAAA